MEKGVEEAGRRSVFCQYLKLQYSSVGGLYALTCGIQILFFMPVPFMLYVTVGLTLFILLVAQMRLYDDMLFGRNAIFYQSLPVSVTQLTVSKILTASTGIWLSTAVMGAVCALARQLMFSSMTMVSFLSGEDEKITGPAAIIAWLVPTFVDREGQTMAENMLQPIPTYYSVGQYSLWFLDLLLLGASASAAIFFLVVVYQTIKRNTGLPLLSLFTGAMTAIVGGLLCYSAMSGWPFGGEDLSFTVKVAVGCGVNFASLLLWGAGGGMLLKKWYAG